ncbi:MAG: hypothetical protein JXR56_09565 [Candidatus Cloacimonetes bacterium]|nr:hypothetical protein [Candidatus Cloacimonadota bacterium]
MRKEIVLISILLFWGISAIQAYEHNFLNLISPTELTDLENEITISHRFLGAVDDEPFDTFFGMDVGANTGFFLRKALIHSLEAKVGYTRLKKSYHLEASFKFTPMSFPVQAQANIRYFSFDEVSQEKRRNNFLYLLAVQNDPLWERIILNTNIGYDGYYERLVNGFGLGVILFDNLTLLSEYYPVWDRDSASERVRTYLGDYDAFAVGLRLDTYGHQFTFLLGNGTGMSPREQSLGTNDKKDLKFGFNLQRRF